MKEGIHRCTQTQNRPSSATLRRSIDCLYLCFLSDDFFAGFRLLAFVCLEPRCVGCRARRTWSVVISRAFIAISARTATCSSSQRPAIPYKSLLTMLVKATRNRSRLLRLTLIWPGVVHDTSASRRNIFAALFSIWASGSLKGIGGGPPPDGRSRKNLATSAICLAKRR